MKKILSLFIILSIGQIGFTAGYVGTLPNVEAEFSYLKKEHSEKASAPYSVKELDKQNEAQLKPIPRNNENYVDIIIKRDKATQYLSDMNSVILIMEKLRKCINTNQDIQKFNAIVSNLIDNVDYIVREYKDKPESNYLSYSIIISISEEARSVADYRTQGLAAEKYIPYNSPDNIYTKENLDKKLQTLLYDVTDSLFVLKNLE